MQIMEDVVTSHPLFYDTRTKEAIDSEGWFKTGDYGYFDEDGFLHLVGRKNDIIVLRNGKNVYPDEIENLINKIPYILHSVIRLNYREHYSIQ